LFFVSVDHDCDLGSLRLVQIASDLCPLIIGLDTLEAVEAGSLVQIGAAYLVADIGGDGFGAGDGLESAWFLLLLDAYRSEIPVPLWCSSCSRNPRRRRRSFPSPDWELWRSPLIRNKSFENAGFRSASISTSGVPRPESVLNTVSINSGSSAVGTKFLEI